FTSRAGRDDIADFNFAIVDDHTVYEQFDQLSALGECELIQSGLQPLAKRLYARSQRSGIQAPLRLGFQFFDLLAQTPVGLRLFLSFPLERRTVNDLCQVKIK